MLPKVLSLVTTVSPLCRRHICGATGRRGASFVGFLIIADVSKNFADGRRNFLVSKPQDFWPGFETRHKTDGSVPFCCQCLDNSDESVTLLPVPGQGRRPRSGAGRRGVTCVGFLIIADVCKIFAEVGENFGPETERF